MFAFVGVSGASEEMSVYWKTPRVQATTSRESDPTRVPKATFEHDVHLFRGVAMILIVLLHSVPSFNWSEQPLTEAVLNALLNQSSMFFFFISGYLFYHLSPKFEYSTYLRRKAATILVPYLVVSVPALLVSLFIIPQVGMWDWFYELPVWQQTILFLLTGKHLAPLWFVPTIILFYIAAPLFVRWGASRNSYWLLPPLLLLAALIGPDGPTGPLQKAAYLLPAYASGIFISRYRAEVAAATRRYLHFIAMALCILVLLLIAEVEGPLDLLILFKLISCPVILLALKKFGTHAPSWASVVASLSFGIYFVHGYVISGFRLLYTLTGGQSWEGNSNLFDPSLMGLGIHAAVVLMVSSAIVLMIKKVFRQRSRQIVGV